MEVAASPHQLTVHIAVPGSGLPEGVQSEEREGQQLAHFAQHLGQQSLFAHQ
jgi:hypothetical protein